MYVVQVRAATLKIYEHYIDELFWNTLHIMQSIKARNNYILKPVCKIKCIKLQTNF